MIDTVGRQRCNQTASGWSIFRTRRRLITLSVYIGSGPVKRGLIELWNVVIDLNIDNR